MTTASDPPLIQSDLPFNVEAVRSPSGRIDALAKRPRLSETALNADEADHDAPVDPKRHIVDTRALIPTDTALPDDPQALPSSEHDTTGIDMQGASKDGSADALVAETTPAASAPEPEPALTDERVDAATDDVSLSELQRRMLDIKTSNESLTRELEALEDSLRQPPTSA